MKDIAVYYYAPVKAPLIRDALLPAVDLARAAGVPAHLERHWLHGPHVRVRLGSADPSLTARLLAPIEAYLAANPSTEDVSQSDLLAQAEASGRAELVPGPYTPIYADNTVRVEDVDLRPMVELLSFEGAVECRHELLRLGIPAVASAVAGPTTTSARVLFSLKAMAAHASRYPLGIGPGHQSFLSHLEEFLLFHDPDGRLRERFEAHWNRQADTVTALVRDVVDTESPWTQWTVAARAATEAVYDRGELPRVPAQAYLTRAEELGDADTVRRWHPERTEYSEYHQLLRQIDFNRVPYEREFVVYRFATNVLYLLLGLADVRPVERYLAAYLLSRAAERITGITWKQRLNSYLSALTREEAVR